MDIKNINSITPIITNSNFENKDFSRLEKPIVKEDLSIAKNEEVKNNKNDFKDTVNKVNQELQKQGMVLDYSKDEKTDRMIIQLRDSKTNEVIKQIPSKEILQIADNIDKFLSNYNKSGNVNKSAIDLSINFKA